MHFVYNSGASHNLSKLIFLSLLHIHTRSVSVCERERERDGVHTGRDSDLIDETQCELHSVALRAMDIESRVGSLLN